MKQDWLKHLPPSLKQDPRKTGMLGVLLLVLMVAGVRAIVKMRPDSAVAVAAASVMAPITQLQTSSVPPPPHQSSASSELLAWINSPHAPLERNLFAIDYAAFPRASGNTLAVSIPQNPHTFWEALEKSKQITADDVKATEIRRENIQTAAASLKVQMIVRGSRNRAMIDGKLVREGDVLERDRDIRLQVTQILEREVIVEQQGIRLRVPMQGSDGRVVEMDRN